MQESVQTPASPCPSCGYNIDGATGVQNKRQPGPGDYSVCLNCAALNVFGEDLRVRKPTQQELDEAPLEVSRVQLAIREVHRTQEWKERSE